MHKKITKKKKLQCPLKNPRKKLDHTSLWNEHRVLPRCHFCPLAHNIPLRGGKGNLTLGVRLLAAEQRPAPQKPPLMTKLVV
jgi:hypothetical protein